MQHISTSARMAIDCGMSVVAGFVTYSVTYSLMASVAWVGVAIVMALVISCIASIFASIASEKFVVPAADKAVGALKGWAATLRNRRNGIKEA